MYRIGEFSLRVNLSINTLRYYNELGLLIPSEVDKFTNYRYYSDENINEAKLIKLLTSLNFTLEEVKNFKDNLTIDVIEDKETELRHQIDELNQKIQTLEFMKEEIQSSKVKKYTTNSKVA